MQASSRQAVDDGLVGEADPDELHPADDPVLPAGQAREGPVECDWLRFGPSSGLNSNRSRFVSHTGNGPR